MANLTYLITGANRGLGQGFTSTLLQRPNTTVVATVRDPEKSQDELSKLPKATGSKLIVLKLRADVDEDASAAISQLRTEHNISAIDVAIANAGISHSGTTVSQTSPDALREHFSVNSVGPVALFQAVTPLLKASKTGNPIFIGISSALGSIAIQPSLTAFPQKLSPYGASKTALNWLFQRVHIEEPWLTSFVFHPGLVLTDMASALASNGQDPRELGAITVDQSIEGMLKTIDGASKEIGGTFQNYDGTSLPW